MKKKSKSILILELEKTVNNFDDLYQLWKDIPVVQNISDSSLYKATNHPIQAEILKILREGIIDTNENKRHFLTANELLDNINSKSDNPIKISMLYYHLDGLQEYQLVEFVYFVEGRHKRKYFGRTAKFYIFGGEEKIKEKIKKFFSPISKLILHFNPDVDINKYEQLVEEIRASEKEFSDNLIRWMEENHELLYELDVDALDLFNAMTIFIVNQGLIRDLYAPLTKSMEFLI